MNGCLKIAGAKLEFCRYFSGFWGVNSRLKLKVMSKICRPFWQVAMSLLDVLLFSCKTSLLGVPYRWNLESAA